MILKSDAKFEEKLICCFKNDKNLVNFDLSTRNSQNFHFDWFLLCKVYNVWPKKVQRSYLSWHWRDVKIEKNWSVVRKMTWGNWQIFTRALESVLSKLGLWWDPFIKIRECISLIFTRELCVMTLKNDEKFVEELTCCFKTDMRNLRNFDPSTRELQKFAL